MPLQIFAQQAPQVPPVIIKGLGHHALFLMLVQLGLLLGVARVLGECMRKIRQPAVIGELLAGLVLGPSVLGWCLPDLQKAIFPLDQSQTDLLSAVSWVGVLLLLVVTGLEVDLDLIVRKARTALGISLGGILVPFVTGFALGWLLPDEFLARPEQRVVFSLFIAVAMSISAIPVIAKVLMDLDLMRRDVGQVILAAAMTDDTIGWILLSVVAGLATKGTLSPEAVGVSLTSAVVFVGLGLSLGPRLMNRYLTWVDEEFHGPAPQLSAILVAALGTASLTHWLGIEAVLGAFVVGIVTARASRLRSEVTHTLELITGSLLAPIFFATAGLKVNLWGLLSPKVMTVAVLAFAVACFGKYVGCYLGGLAGGLTHWERLAMGSGMNARGAMEIIVATLGLSLGVLNQDTYSVIVAIAITTSLMAPPMLRWTLSHVEMRPEEAQRVEQERQAEGSFVHSIKRVLVPSRGGRNVQFAAQLMGHFSRKRPVEITALFVDVPDLPDRPDPAVAKVQSELALAQGPTPQVKVLPGKNVLDVILSKARRGYHLLVLGASDAPSKAHDSPFPPLMDKILQGAPCPTMIVKAGPEVQESNIGSILVPTVGTHYSNHAVEVAGVLGASLGASVTIVHVLPGVDVELLWGGQDKDPSRELAEQIVDSQADIARHLGAEVATAILQGNSPESLIVELAREQGFGLIVMGTNLRPLMKRAFLGQRVESILRDAPCAVAIVSSL